MCNTTILDELRGINAYPIPCETIQSVCRRRGLDAMQTVTPATTDEDAFKLAKADLLMWLSRAPNVSQGGQSYSFSEDQRREMRNSAGALYDEVGEEGGNTAAVFGYKGSRL